MAKLFIVATPIGNLEDITLRALRVLKEETDIIACEDTRHSSLLLKHFDIKKRTIACHSYNEEESAKGIIKILDEGKNVAYLSDAGTPGVSDPGARLVERVRSEKKHEIIPLPGPSAFTTLLSASGFIGKSFTFEGFLSPKSGRRKKRLFELSERGETFIIYESPYRVKKTLEEINSLDGVKKVIVGRELTKAFEEIIADSPSVVLSYFSKKDNKGEFVIIVVMGDLSDNNKETEES